MDLRRGISMAVDAVVTNLKSRARMISTSEEIAQVCQSNFARASCILQEMIIRTLSFNLIYVFEFELIGRDNIC